jgi:hypothetical protein
VGLGRPLLVRDTERYVHPQGLLGPPSEKFVRF